MNDRWQPSPQLISVFDPSGLISSIAGEESSDEVVRILMLAVILWGMIHRTIHVNSSSRVVLCQIAQSSVKFFYVGFNRAVLPPSVENFHLLKVPTVTTVARGRALFLTFTKRPSCMSTLESLLRILKTCFSFIITYNNFSTTMLFKRVCSPSGPSDDVRRFISTQDFFGKCFPTTNA